MRFWSAMLFAITGPILAQSWTMRSWSILKSRTSIRKKHRECFFVGNIGTVWRIRLRFRENRSERTCSTSMYILRVRTSRGFAEWIRKLKSSESRRHGQWSSLITAELCGEQCLFREGRERYIPILLKNRLRAGLSFTIALKYIKKKRRFSVGNDLLVESTRENLILVEKLSFLDWLYL